MLTNNFEQALDILESSSKLDNRFGCLWIALKYFHAEQQKMEPNNQQPEFNDLVKQHSSSSISSYSSVKLTSPVHSLSSMSPNNRSAYVSATMSHTQSSKTAESFVNESVLEECNRIIEHFGNPYLKALFNFILNKDEAISKILVIILIRLGAPTLPNLLVQSLKHEKSKNSSFLRTYRYLNKIPLKV